MVGKIHQEPADGCVRGKSRKDGTGRSLSAAVLGALLCCALGAPAGAAQTVQTRSELRQAPDARAERQGVPAASDAPKRAAGLKASIPDVEVVNQDGKRVRFYSDLIEGKAFVVSFVFTTCTFVCPMQGDSLSKIQAMLGERLGKDVNLISVSTDPGKDTPARLKAWGARFGAKQGWTLVTGGESEIGKLAQAFTGSATFRGEHSPIIFVGSDEKGTWVRAYGLSGPAITAKLIEDMTGRQGTEPGRK